MTQTVAALEAAAALRERFVGPSGYGLAYGSHPAGTASATSDLDLVLIGPRPLRAGELKELVDGIRQLHHKHGLGLDDEVDHAVKVHATFTDVQDAVALRCFPLDERGHLIVPPVIVEPWFLNSEPFRLRLLLNALTSPHAFLGGAIERYDAHRRDAERAVALLALALHPDAVITAPEAAQHLVQHADGARGEDFLGYQPGPHVDTVLRRGFARLAGEGLVRDLDGQRFTFDPTAVATKARTVASGPA